MKYIIYNKTSEDMKDIKDETISCIFQSPPYALAKDYQNEKAIGVSDKSGAYKEYLLRMSNVFKECYRVLQPGRYIGINIGFVIQTDKHGSERKPIPFHFYNLCKRVGFIFKDMIIWKKPSGMSSQRRFGVFMQNPYPMYYYPENIYEPILIFQKPGKFELTDKDKEQNKCNYEAFRPFSNDIWDIMPETNVKHPAPFPWTLPKIFFQLHSLKGETVLDCFGGSGSSMKAARTIRRNCILYEINPNYIDLILERSGFAVSNQGTLEKFSGVKSDDKVEVIK